MCAGIILLSPLIANAEPKNITTISAEQLSQLETLHQQATDLLIKNDFQGALHAYSDILLNEPDDETAYTGLGQIYMVLGQLKKARDAFENALHINPDNQVALHGMQKIMDPDGVDGMTYRAEVEGWTEAPVVDPGYAAVAKTAQRLGPLSPVQKKMAPVTPKKKRTPKNFRMGLLNAQRIQMCLTNAGVYYGPVNGVLGSSTRKALRIFQKIHGFKETGAADTATLEALLPYLAYGKN